MREGLAVAAKCSETTFSVAVEDEAELIKGVGRFNFLGRLLYR